MRLNRQWLHDHYVAKTRYQSWCSKWEEGNYAARCLGKPLDPEEELWAGRELNLKSDKALTSLGRLTRVGHSLNACGCTSLASVGDLKSVGSNLYISYTALTSLAGVTVGGNLVVDEGTLLTLTDVGSVGGRVLFTNRIPGEEDTVGSLAHFRKLIAHWTAVYADRPDQAAYDLLAAPRGSVHLACARAALEHKLNINKETP